MESPYHPLSALFRQLGLDDSPQGIDQFIHSHALPADGKLDSAPFWTPAQAQFLAEAIASDSDWSEVVDELAARLES